MSPAAKDLWSVDEYVVVADLYLRRGRSSGVHDPDVRALAELTGRSPASVSRRLGNFEGTMNAGRGLKPVTGEAMAVFDKMVRDPSYRASAVALARTRLSRGTTLAKPGDARGASRPRLVDPENFVVLDEIEIASEATARRLRRAEAALVHAYRAWIDPTGDRCAGIVIPVGRELLRVDLYDTHLDLLIEAKGKASRDAIRYAVGQLLDYRRYLSVQQIAILVPTKPNDDLVRLPEGLGIGIIWRSGDGFCDTKDGLLTRRR